MNLTFPIRLWFSFEIRPSQVILNALFQRELAKMIRNGKHYREAKYQLQDEFDEDKMRLKYNLPYETERYTLSSKNWDEFIRLNSFQSTRKQAREFLETHKILKNEN